MALNLLEADEADEVFEADEADEAGGRRFFRPAQVASGRDLYRPRPQTQYVTQAQLETALARVGSQVRTNSNAIGQLGNRVSATAAAVNKESGNRKKETTAIRNNLSQTQQLAAILPMLTQPRSITVGGLPASVTGLKDGTQVLVDGSNTLNLLLPLLLLTSIGDGGSGSGSGSGPFGGSGDSSSLMMLALILSTQRTSP
jgi:hypothetical protein